MLAEWTADFRRFLAAFEGHDCPSCAVVNDVSRREIARLVSSQLPSALNLCSRHLVLALEAIDRSWKSRLVRAAIRGQSGALEQTRPPNCCTCARVAVVDAKLARSICRLDGRIRFQKGLENAPLFCHRHATRIGAAGTAGNFIRTQLRKLSQLSDELSQAELRGRETEPLIEQALRCFGVQPRDTDADELGTIPEPTAVDESADVENKQFAFWEERRRDALIGKLESELAALRYRNGILEQENRRLTLAYNALDMMRRDLERDRRNMMREQLAGKK